MPVIRSVQEFMSHILSRDHSSDKVMVYRGLSDHHYTLTPSVFRSDINKQNEHILLRELIAAQPDEFRDDLTTLEQLVRMQHYALPTRLLDVSFNPLVALYFASEEDKKRVPRLVNGKRVRRLTPMRGSVVMLTIDIDRIKYFDSDTVSCIANLAKLPWGMKSKIDTSMAAGEFNERIEIRRLLHFIRQENYQFDPEIVPSHLYGVILVKPKLNNKRILAQNGAFFVFGLTETLDRFNEFGIRLEQIEVSASSKENIRKDLDKLNINEKTLFPEIERTAKYLATNNAHHAAILSGDPRRP